MTQSVLENEFDNDYGTMSMGMGPGRSFPDFDDYQVKLHFACPKSDHQSSFFFGTGSRWELSAEKKALCKIEHKHCQALYVSNSLVEERIDDGVGMINVLKDFTLQEESVAVFAMLACLESASSYSS